MGFVRRRVSGSSMILHEVLEPSTVEGERGFYDLIRRLGELSDRLYRKIEPLKKWLPALKKEVEVFLAPYSMSEFANMRRDLERYGELDPIDVRNGLFWALRKASMDVGRYSLILDLLKSWCLGGDCRESRQVELFNDLAELIASTVDDAIRNCDRWYYETKKHRLEAGKFEEAVNRYYDCLRQAIEPQVKSIEGIIDRIDTTELRKVFKTLLTKASIVSEETLEWLTELKPKK